LKRGAKNSEQNKINEDRRKAGMAQLHIIEKRAGSAPSGLQLCFAVVCTVFASLTHNFVAPWLFCVHGSRETMACMVLEFA
jgi:hypothetical protein